MDIMTSTGFQNWELQIWHATSKWTTTVSMSLTVQLCRTQSRKYCEAENFRLMTTEMPDKIAWPMPKAAPAEWYKGRGQYIT
jgi:hypothetical protein